MDIPPKYQTFWRRFWAGWIDALVLAPLWFVDSWLDGSATPPLLLALWYIFSTFSYDLYSVAMHAKYGQTIGKMVMGVRVLDVTESKLSIRQALLRDAVPILLSMIATVQGLPLVLAGLDPFKPGTEFSWIDIISTFGLVLWFGAELATMLTNSKRRAIHDYIAGSVVVRVDYLDAEAKIRASAA